MKKASEDDELRYSWMSEPSVMFFRSVQSPWEQQAAFYIDRHRSVLSFVKNAGLGFTVPYMYNGEMHDFIPDFIVRLIRPNGEQPLNLILETKGYGPLREVKEAAADRWVNAVNIDGSFGKWRFRMANSVADVSYILDEDAALTESTLS